MINDLNPTPGSPDRTPVLPVQDSDDERCRHKIDEVKERKNDLPDVPDVLAYSGDLAEFEIF